MILITRPQPEANILASKLQHLGHDTIVDPMLSVFPFPHDTVSLEGVQALLFTSLNGVRHFAKIYDQRNMPIYIVGLSSAEAANKLGFQFIKSADNDVKDLFEIARQDLDPNKGTLIHFSGQDVQGDLVQWLQDTGFKASRTILYQAEMAETLSSQTISALTNQEISCGLFFSPRTARNFVRLVNKSNLTGDCATMTALCLSENIAHSLDELPWKSVQVAPTPTQTDLIDLLNTKPPEVAHG